jgi:membrane-bound lytic murein transglycosylase A
MNVNKSYVFFTETKGEGPLGGENVPLTPERSMAIDRSLFPYGLPFGWRPGTRWRKPDQSAA